MGGVFYRYAGPGAGAPAMVHVHGFGISGDSLLPTAALLADEFETFVPDLPGHGRSPGTGEVLGIRELGDSVLRFLDDLGIERATMVGNSLGCPIIVRLAERHPERVERAVLVSPAGGTRNRPLVRGLGQLMIDGLREPPGLLRAALPAYLRFGPLNGIKLFNLMTSIPVVRHLRDLRVPTLVVVGSRDPLLPPASRIDVLSAAAQSQGHTTVVRIHGAAHAINFSHPTQLSAVISAYMADPGLHDAGLPADVEVLARASSPDTGRAGADGQPERTSP